MHFGRAEFRERRKMLWRSVPLVLGEAIAGNTDADLGHEGVAGDLRDDRSGRDGANARIALHDRRRGASEIDGQAVDEDVIDLASQTREGAAHRLGSRGRDASRVDLGRRDVGDSECDGSGADERIESNSCVAVEPLRVRDAPGQEVCWKDHRGRGDRTGERASAHLVYPSDGRKAALGQLSLERTYVIETARLAFVAFEAACRRRDRLDDATTRVGPMTADECLKMATICVGETSAHFGYGELLHTE